MRYEVRPTAADVVDKIRGERARSGQIDAIEDGAPIPAGPDQSRIFQQTQIGRQRVRAHVEGGGNLPGAHSVGGMTHQQPKDREPTVVAKGREGTDCNFCFYNSRIIEFTVSRQ